MTTVLSYGGGINSKALGIKMVEKGMRPDAILFADTLGEKPNTYADVIAMSAWFQSKGFPPITTVRIRKGLEEDCVDRKTMPAIAFGFKTCSQRWKIRPQDNWLKVWPPACEAWARGEKLIKYLGMDADEPERANQPSDLAERKMFENRFPLLDWDMGRDECEQTIRDAGLPLPGKSACFFCPQTSPSEVMELYTTYPNLALRAIQMERDALANLKRRKTLKGLGMKYAWRDLIDGKMTVAEAEKLAGRKKSMPCGCHDQSEKVQPGQDKQDG